MTHSLLRTFAIAPLVWLSAASVSAAEFEKFLFDSADVVVVVEVKKALAAPLVKKNMPEGAPSELLKKAPIPDEKAKKLVEDPEFAALVDLLAANAERVAIVASNKSGGDKALVVIEGRFDDKVLDKGLHAAAKAGGGDVSKFEIDGAQVYQLKKDQSVWLARMDNAIVLGPNEEMVKEAVSVNGGKKRWAGNDQLAGHIGKAGSGKTVWAAGTDPRQGIGFHGGLTVSEDLDVDFTVEAKDEENAKQLEGAAAAGLEQAGMLGQTVPDLAEVLKSIKVVREGKSLNIKAKATAAQLEKLSKTLPALLLGAG